MVNSVFGFRPKCIWNAVFRNLVWGVILIVSNAQFRLSVIFLLSIRFASIFSFSVLTPLSTNPVGVCMYGVPYISLIFLFLEYVRNSLPVKAVPLSVLIIFGKPYIIVYCFIKSITVFPSVVLTRLAAGHLLNRSMDSKINILRFLNMIGPMKSNWISSFGSSNGGSLFFL